MKRTGQISLIKTGSLQATPAEVLREQLPTGSLACDPRPASTIAPLCLHPWRGRRPVGGPRGRRHQRRPGGGQSWEVDVDLMSGVITMDWLIMVNG